MEINKRIYELIDREGLGEEGILYLCAVYFHLDTSIFKDITKTKINSLKIFDKDYKTGKITWNIPLFGDFHPTGDFIEQYRDLFRQVDRTKVGDRPTVIKKFKEFNKKYPQYTNQDILEATKLYLEEYVASNATTHYLQKATYFIMKERNPKGSRLLEYLEILDEEKRKNKIYDRY